MSLKSGAEGQAKIGKRLHEIVDSCLEIDATGIATKRQKVLNDQKDA